MTLLVAYFARVKIFRMISKNEIRDLFKEQLEPKFDDREIDDSCLEFGKFLDAVPGPKFGLQIRER